MSLPSLHLLNIGAPGLECLGPDILKLVDFFVGLGFGVPKVEPREALLLYDKFCAAVADGKPPATELIPTFLALNKDLREQARRPVNENNCRDALLAIFRAYNWTAFLEKDSLTGLIVVREQQPLPAELKALRDLASLHAQLYADEQGNVEAVSKYALRQAHLAIYGGSDGFFQAARELQWLRALLPHLRFGHTREIGPEFKKHLKTHAADANVGAWSPQRLFDGTEMFGAESSNFVGVGIGEWTLRELECGDRMFAWCRRFAPTDISQWNLGKLVNGERMFWFCKSFNPTGMESLDFSKLQNARHMFTQCSSLLQTTNLDWKFTELKYGSNMFHFCEKFAPTDISQWILG